MRYWCAGSLHTKIFISFVSIKTYKIGYRVEVKRVGKKLKVKTKLQAWLLNTHIVKKPMSKLSELTRAACNKSEGR